ncbi:MAG: hypothetical protein IIZ86_01835, partial [Firmicutes bacterium]|nr:hypothetical protein [Bacillota bacterium]
LVMDAGTTSIKAGLISMDGKFVDIQNVPAEVLMPFSGASEMNMDDVWEVAKKVILKLKANNEAFWPEVIAVGLSAQGDGLWAIDDKGRPVRNAMLWNDTRTVLDYEALNPTLLAKNTTAMFPGANIAELTWLKKNEPENYARIAWIFHCKDWINFKLTGQIGTDASDASTSLMNIYTKKYDEEILDWLGLPEMKGKLAPISTSDAKAQFLRRIRIDRSDDLVGGGDGSEFSLHLRQTQPIQDLFVVLFRIDVHQRGRSVGSVRADLTGELKVDPVLAVEDPGNLCIVLRFVLLQPRQFRDVGAGEHGRRILRKKRRI